MAKKKKPLKSTDKRRSGYGPHVRATVMGNDGSGKPLIASFNDRRKSKSGQGKRAS